MPSVDVTLLTQQECGFCDDARQILGRLGADYPLRVRIVDVATPEGERLATDARMMFPPGILIDGEPFSYGRPSERKLRRALDRRLAAS